MKKYRINAEQLRLDYVTQLKLSEETTVEQAYQDLLELYQSHVDWENGKGTTMYGPQRDDIHFMVNGEKRSVVWLTRPAANNGIIC